MKLVAGNWKMNHGPAATRTFLDSLTLPQGAVEVVLFPPAISLAEARRALGTSSPIALGVQNLHPETSGAFTGEISAEMAAEAGASFALAGHSERRHLFGEEDGEVGRKVQAILRAGLTPVLCVGETLEERRNGKLESVLRRQLEGGIREGDAAERVSAGSRLVLAYEPVWAIGTGETATPEDASAAHGLLRTHLEALLGAGPAGSTSVLYGGSVNESNAGELMSAPDVDGVLVGGASLQPESFAGIVRGALAAS
jgi:triosephosphate isomerase (TIM)